MLIPFVKMHGLGNDFVILNNLDLSLDVKNLPITQWSDRRTGVGFDQILIIEPSQHADFFCRIFNADGSEAYQCGNGLRCVARFVHEEHFIEKQTLTIATQKMISPVTIQSYDHIQVEFAPPIIEERLIALPLFQETIELSILSLGNLHTIVRREHLYTVDNANLAAKIANHQRFPSGVNVGFMQIRNDRYLQLQTFERGSGETDACGSNACAAVISGIINGWLNHAVTVEVKKGKLLVSWSGEKSSVYLTGPAARSFAGQLSMSKPYTK